MSDVTVEVSVADREPAQVTITSAIRGPEGKSAYQVWLDAGNTGTVDDYISSLSGGDIPDFTAIAAAVDADAAAAAASVVAATAAVASVNDPFTRIGVDRTTISTQSTGSTSSSAVGGSLTRAYGNNLPCPADGELIEVKMRLAATGTGRIMILDPIGRVRSETAVSSGTLASGIATITLASLPIFKGDFVHYYPDTGGTLYNSTGLGRYFTTTLYTGGVGSVVPVTEQTGNASLQYTIRTIGETMAGEIAGLDAEIEAEQAQSAVDKVAFNSAAPVSGQYLLSAGFYAWAIRQDAGVTLPVGMIVTGISGYVIPNASATMLAWKVLRRPLASGDIDGYPYQADDVVLFTGNALLTDLGISAGVGARVTIPTDQFEVEAGFAYIVVLTSRNANQGLLIMGVGSFNSADTIPARRGMYSGSNGQFSATTANVISFGLTGYAPAATGKFDYRVIEASAAVTGAVVTVTGKLALNRTIIPFSTTQTLTVGTSNPRYDTIYLNLDDMTFGVAVGTEAAADAMERIPAVTQGQYLPLFNVRVTSTWSQVVAVWNVYDGEHAETVEQMEQERRWARRQIPKTRAKIFTGGSLRILSIGDSISALGSNGNGTTSPNGGRDKGRLFFDDAISSDLVDAIPVYTHVQIGRASDANGSVYTRVGLIWSIVNAIEARGLHTLGTNLFYDNFSVSGTASVSLWASGAPTTWLNNATAYCTANSVSLVVIHMGMNEVDASTTRANMIAIIAAFKAVGAEVLVVGAWRPRGSASNWDKVSMQLREASYEGGAAYCSFRAILMKSYIGAIGIASADLCAANGSNHPGIIEQAAGGRLLARMVVE